MFKKKITPRENKRTRDTISFKEAFSDMLDAYKIKQKFEESNIVAKWEEITGKTIASRTSRIFIKEKQLFLEISSPPLKQQLLMSKTKLLELLNRGHEDPIITDIKFI
ncbi:MAG TPA: DUF721 domain-containing protein [Cytophagales bacterium]|nr:DUF721 domain-containing protein [Cytophagales bacterium]